MATPAGSHGLSEGMQASRRAVTLACIPSPYQEQTVNFIVSIGAGK